MSVPPGDKAERHAAGGKVVGRRSPRTADWEDVRRLLRTAAALRLGPDLVPRGVYRFDSFEETDAWLIQTIARRLARRKSRTSSGSTGSSCSD